MAGWVATGVALGMGAVVLGWIACGGSRLDPPSDWLGHEADAMAVPPSVDVPFAEQWALNARVFQLRRKLQRHRGFVLQFKPRGGSEAA